MADRGADHPYAVRFPELFQEPVRDCPLAVGEKELLDVPQAHQLPQPLDAQVV